MPHLLEIGLHTIILHQGEGITRDHSRHISTSLPVIIRKCQHDHDHLSKKKLTYDSKSRGRNFRESLNVVTETKTATKIGSDDETQDDSLTESPAPKTSSKGEVSSAVLVEDNGESQSLNEESQSFNYESWEKEQIAVARKIAGTDT